MHAPVASALALVKIRTTLIKGQYSILLGLPFSLLSTYTCNWRYMLAAVVAFRFLVVLRTAGSLR